MQQEDVVGEGSRLCAGRKPRFDQQVEYGAVN
jgi:hypothetical protein